VQLECSDVRCAVNVQSECSDVRCVVRKFREMSMQLEEFREIRCVVRGIQGD
jgi:hypothetical protein